MEVRRQLCIRCDKVTNRSRAQVKVADSAPVLRIVASDVTRWRELAEFAKEPHNGGAHIRARVLLCRTHLTAFEFQSLPEVQDCARCRSKRDRNIPGCNRAPAKQGTSLRDDAAVAEREKGVLIRVLAGQCNVAQATHSRRGGSRDCGNEQERRRHQ